jgi:hypothetical protein
MIHFSKILKTLGVYDEKKKLKEFIIYFENEKFLT